MDKDREGGEEGETTDAMKEFVVDEDEEVVKVVAPKKAPRGANLRPRRGGSAGGARKPGGNN
jgi:hypothetical protein